MTDRRGQGTLYQRGATFWLQYWHRGKRYRESTHSTRRADALKLLRRRMGEMGTGRLIGKDAERLSLEDVFVMLVDDYTINGRRSLARVQNALTHLRAFFGFARALDITADRLTAYVRARREEGAAVATIKNELAALKRGFTLAIKAERLPQRPAFPTLTTDNARRGFFERAEFEALRAELAPELRAVVTTAYLTGWRVPSEVLTLEWSRVDFTAGIVRLDTGTTKNGEGRVFPFDAIPELADVLHTQREVTDDVQRRTGAVVRYVFHRDGKPIRDFRDAWAGACKRAGLVARIPHDFRRTAVRNLVRAGVSEHTAMKLTGHKTRSVFDRYDIVNEADLRVGVAKLATLAQPRTILPFKQARG